MVLITTLCHPEKGTGFSGIVSNLSILLLGSYTSYQSDENIILKGVNRGAEACRGFYFFSTN